MPPHYTVWYAVSRGFGTNFLRVFRQVWTPLHRQRRQPTQARLDKRRDKSQRESALQQPQRHRRPAPRPGHRAERQHGEPDIDIRKQKDGKLVVEIKGVDIYDPTSGEIRSNSTDDIACWFIDTDYNEECFFVRQAYFCGGDKPYEKLKRALKAEVAESAWETLYSTVSRPFDKPPKNKIAVKVINHYGDEVLKVYQA